MQHLDNLCWIETTRKWKNCIWVITNGDKVPLCKRVLLKYFNQVSKDANSSQRCQKGSVGHNDEFVCCTRCIYVFLTFWSPISKPFFLVMYFLFLRVVLVPHHFCTCGLLIYNMVLQQWHYVRFFLIEIIYFF